MKKTLLSAFALLLTFAVVGCEPTATDTTDDTVIVTPDTATDSNVTATAETPAAVETPAATEEAPAADAPAADADDEPAAGTPSGWPTTRAQWPGGARRSTA